MIPETEFRTLPVSSPEPTDRISEGTVVGIGASLALGTVDTTDEAQDLPVSVVWWRVKDMKGNSEISNIRVWLEGTDSFIGMTAWYMDISDLWTTGKTSVEVQTGSPGTAPTTEASAVTAETNYYLVDTQELAAPVGIAVDGTTLQILMGGIG